MDDEQDLLRASACGDAVEVERLLKKGVLFWRVDVNARDRKGETPLHKACARGHLNVIELLLQRGADVNAHTDVRDTPLHVASSAEVINLLKPVKGLQVDAVGRDGETPLHCACLYGRVEIASALLDAGASLDVETEYGYNAMHTVLFGVYRSARRRTTNALQLLQVLISHGAVWDDKCEAIANGVDPVIQPNARSTQASRQLWWKKVGPALSFAAHLWIEEHLERVVFTQLDEDTIERGLVAVRTHAVEIKGSKHIICRRKICLVGPSQWGKTSLAKSIMNGKVCLEHVDDRTVGIDHFKLTFDEPLEGVKLQQRKHEVTFSDFAGQDAYQVMHSLFFTKRTLFFICVDLEAYSVALLKAEMLTPDDATKQERMNEFVDRNIVRWVRIIFARQPDAEFVFVCTKEDTIHPRGPCVDKKEVLEDVKKMLGRVTVIIRDMKRKFEANQDNNSGELPAFDPPLISHLWDPELESCALPDFNLMTTSCATSSSVDQMRREVTNLIVKSGNSYEMPDKYTAVLNELIAMKLAAQDFPVHLRIFHTFKDVQELIKSLQSQVPNLDVSTAKEILRSLRDRGDILWYEEMEVEKLETTIMLDPLLLIEFIKRVISHEHTTEIISHAALEGLPFWMHLRKDEKILLMMKQLLQKFHLVHPAPGSEMVWKSDLIVPAYWQTKRHAMWLFGGEGLRLSMQGTDAETVARRIHWEFRFFNYLPDALFDHLVVASYSASHPREVGPDWILYRNGQVSACRVVLSRDARSHRRSLRLEAVIATHSDVDTSINALVLWEVFERVCKALACVLAEHPGLLVSSSACTGLGPDQPSLTSLVEPTVQFQMWMPPEPTRSRCLAAQTTGRRPREMVWRSWKDLANAVWGHVLGYTSTTRLALVNAPMRIAVPEGSSELLKACAEGDAAMVRHLLESQVVNIDAHAEGDLMELGPLHVACYAGHTAIVRLLVVFGADVNRTNKDGITPLLIASCEGYADIVKLLTAEGADVDVESKDGTKALLEASRQGHDDVVKVLVSANADVDMVDENDRIALHWARNVAVVECLLSANDIHIHANDFVGKTPLHTVSEKFYHDVAAVLCNAGADVRARDKEGHFPIHSVLVAMRPFRCEEIALKTLQVLVSNGSMWDATCKMIAYEQPIEGSTSRVNEKWIKLVAPAVKICITTWTNDRVWGRPPMDIPIEQVRSGKVATRAYFSDLEASGNVIIQHKVCVVGPANWGKSSLIKSITTNKPTLTAINDRTIGIDHFHLTFEEGPGADGTNRHLLRLDNHEVTFWDFAGQEEYQVANSLFFTRRTLFLICIDLEAYVKTRWHAEMAIDSPSERSRSMNDFLETNVLRLIKVIIARQPDATVAFVGTKRDLISDEELFGDDGGVMDLKKRLSHVMMIVDNMKSSTGQQTSDLLQERNQLPITHLSDPRLDGIKHFHVPMILSGSTSESHVADSKEMIQDLIIKSGRGFPMPDTFSCVLDAVRKRRYDAHGWRGLHATFVKSANLVQELLVEVQMVTTALILTILRTLRDLGEILWFEDVEDEFVRATVMLNPSLVIDLLKEVVNHKHHGDVVHHSMLKSLPSWSLLSSSEEMLVMKRVLQHLGLVLPARGEMTWDSDLILPVHWKFQTCASAMFAGSDLRLTEGVQKEDVAVRVHFEFEMVNIFPETLFDQIVIASYSPLFTRKVGPDWIMLMKEGSYTCRLTIAGDFRLPTLHLEALQGHLSSATDVSALWQYFQLLSTSLENVLRRYPAVVVNRYALVDADADLAPTRYSLDELRAIKLSESTKTWMPPAEVWDAYLEAWET